MTLDDPSGLVPLDGIDLAPPLDRHTAILGDAASGKAELGLLLGRLAQPRSGLILLGGVDFARLPYAATGRRIGYVGPAASLFAGSLYDNLVAELRRWPVTEDEDGRLRFGRKGGALDYAAAGVAGEAGLRVRLRHVLGLAGLEADVIRLGLQRRLDPQAEPEAVQLVLTARMALEERLAKAGLGGLVERFDPARFNANMSLGENLLFGTPLDAGMTPERLVASRPVRRVLDRLRLTPVLVEIGRSIAATMVEIFADLPPGHDYFDRFAFVAQDELPDYARLLQRADRRGVNRLKARDRTVLLALSFKLVEARHRLGLIDDELRRRLVAARRAMRAELPAAFLAGIEFFEPERYSAAASILDNLLFGRVAYGVPEASPRIEAAVAALIETAGLEPILLSAGLGSPVGSAGARLTPLQRQKVAIGRAVLKRPDLLVLNQATQLLDPAGQGQVLAALCQEFAGRAVVAVLPRAEFAAGFDRVVVLERGRIVEQGDTESLDRPDSSLTMMRQAEAS